MIRFGGPKNFDEFEPIKPEEDYKKFFTEEKPPINIKVYKKNIEIEAEKYIFSKKETINFDEKYIFDPQYKFFKNLSVSLKEINDEEKKTKLEFFKKPILLCGGEKEKEKNFKILKYLVNKDLNYYNLYFISKKNVLDNLKKDNGELWLINLLDIIKKNNKKNIVYIEDLEELFYNRDKNYIPEPENRVDNPKHKIFINLFLTYLDDLIQDENFILFFNINRKVLDLYKNFQSVIVTYDQKDFKIVEFNPDLEIFSDYLKKNKLENKSNFDDEIISINEKLKKNFNNSTYFCSIYKEYLENKENFIKKIKEDNVSQDEKKIESLMEDLKRIRVLIFSRNVVKSCILNNIGRGLDQALFRAERFGLKIETDLIKIN